MLRSIFAVSLFLCVCQCRAQVLGTNLIVNGDAETGQSAGWDVQGTINILSYESRTPIDLKAGDLAPVNRGTSYFAGDSTRGSARMVQIVDLSGLRRASIPGM